MPLRGAKGDTLMLSTSTPEAVEENRSGGAVVGDFVHEMESIEQDAMWVAQNAAEAA
jgi:hypothetical protein